MKTLLLAAALALHVPLGSTIEDLVVDPDGGAWVSIRHHDSYKVGRAGPGQGFALTPADARLEPGGAFGPGGAAWLISAEEELVRADRDGSLRVLHRSES